jgi:hypothetical protein
MLSWPVYQVAFAPNPTSPQNRAHCLTEYVVPNPSVAATGTKSLLKEQPTSRWSMVSGWWSQSAHLSSSCRLWLLRLAEVQTRSCKASQIKNLHFPGARVLWSERAPGMVCSPLEKARYADAVENEPSLDHLQITRSGESIRFTSWIRFQRERNSKSTCTVRPPLISLTHLLSCSAS